MPPQPIRRSRRTTPRDDDVNGLSVMVRRQLRVNRTLLVVLATVIAINNVIQVTAYQSIFPNAATRAATLASFTSNTALRAFYGYPYDIASPTGWLSWRSLGFIALVMAVWGAFITVGALRGDEEAGRAELALSQPQPRRVWFMAALVAVTIQTLAIGAVTVAALAAFCVTQGLMTFVDCLESSLQLMLPALLFAAVGAVTAQLIGTTRGARIAAAAVLAVALVVRTAADAGNGLSWLRWMTPLGWVEEVHPPAAPSPAALIAIAVSFVVLVTAAQRMLAVRDIGLGLLPRNDSRKPRRFLLASPWQAALRDDLPQLSFWLVGSLIYTLLLGSLSRTLLDLVTSNSAIGAIFGRSFALNAFVAASFSIVQVIVTLLVVTMVVRARGEEASGRLEMLVAEPLSRIRWLLSQTVLASGTALVLALVSAASLWAGVATAGQNVALGPLIAAALNCIPLIVLGAGTAVAVLGLAPRAVAFVYAPVAVAYLWDALGTALKAPAWTLDLSPFHALAAVPAQDFAFLPAAILTVLGLALTLVGASVFRTRDLVAA
jgi:ABC-2 type transport system permease protein